MHDQKSARDRLREELASAPLTALAGAAVGAVLALFAILVGMIRMVVALVAGTRLSFEELGLLAYYVGGFVAGGALAGLLWPFRRWIGGYYGLGVIVMGFVAFGIALAEDGPVAGWSSATWLMIVVLSLVFGLALGYGASRASTE